MTIQAREFAAYHLPALEREEARNHLIVALIDRVATGAFPGARLWTLGNPGACALQTPGRSIVLGELSLAQCQILAEQTQELDWPGVVGLENTPRWFADKASVCGAEFIEATPMMVHAIEKAPRYPRTLGEARPVQVEELSLFFDWMNAFWLEAIPHDPSPQLEGSLKSIEGGGFLFWWANGEPVSVAGIVRRTKATAAVAAVYTPPALRGRGYAGSVVAALVDLGRAQGRSTACLYTDLRNPFSHRCYAKVGFEPICKAWQFVRNKTNNN